MTGEPKPGDSPKGETSDLVSRRALGAKLVYVVQAVLAAVKAEAFALSTPQPLAISDPPSGANNRAWRSRKHKFGRYHHGPRP